MICSYIDHNYGNDQTCNKHAIKFYLTCDLTTFSYQELQKFYKRFPMQLMDYHGEGRNWLIVDTFIMISCKSHWFIAVRSHWSSPSGHGKCLAITKLMESTGVLQSKWFYLLKCFNNFLCWNVYKKYKSLSCDELNGMLVFCVIDWNCIGVWFPSTP